MIDGTYFTGEKESGTDLEMY